MEKRNCREYCQYAEICKIHYQKFTGEKGLHPDECPMAWRIEDTIEKEENDNAMP